MPFTSRFRLKFRWAKLAAACLVLTGCDKPPPAAAPTSEPAALQTTAPKPLAFGACADPNVIATVLKMVRDNSGAGPLMADGESQRVALLAFGDGTAPLSLHAVRTVARDDRLSRSRCEAALRITLSGATFEMMAGNLIAAASVGAAGWKREGNANTASVTVEYVSQPTDDGRDAIVELSAARQVSAAAGLLAVAAWVAKSKAPQQTQSEASSTPGCEDIDMSTGIGIRECQGRSFEAADAALNQAYKVTMARLAPERQQVLRSQQRAWVTRRNPECESDEDKQGSGGTQATLNIIGCATNKTVERTAEIQAFK